VFTARYGLIPYLQQITFSVQNVKVLDNVFNRQGYSKRWSAGAFAFTQTAYLLKLVIPTTNALPR